MKIDVVVIAAALLAGIVALMAGWMVVASAFAGILMWSVQRDIVSSRSFDWVRRYGPRKGAWRLIRVMRRRGIARHLLTRSARRRVVPALLVPFVGFMAPASLPYVVSLLLRGARRGDELADGLGKAILLTGVPGALVAVGLFLSGLRYIARPDKPRRKLPALRFPESLSSRGRGRLAANAFWYEKTHTAGLLAAMYPVVVFVALLPAADQPAREAPKVDPSTPPLLNMIILLLMLAPVIVPAKFAAARLRRRLAAWRLPVEICQVLEPPAEDDPADWLEVPEDIRDPAESHRSRLICIAQLLTQAAARVDARQPRGFAPHPTSTVFRAVSESIRQHLQSPHSYGPTIPADLQETLRMVLGLLAEPQQTSALLELAARVDAFDENGKPAAVESFVKPPGRLAVTMTKLTNSAQRTAAVVTAMAGMAATFIAVALAIVGKIDSDALVGHLK